MRAYIRPQAEALRCLNSFANPATIQCPFSRVRNVIDIDAPPAQTTAAVRHAIDLLTQSQRFLDFYGAGARPLYCEVTRRDGTQEVQAMLTKTKNLDGTTKSTKMFVAVAEEPLIAAREAAAANANANVNGNANQQQQQQPPPPQPPPQPLANQVLPVANQQHQPVV